VSQAYPERDKISNFGENEFITQNSNFYRKQYEQVFKFLESDPTGWTPHTAFYIQIIRNNIDEGDVFCQQYLQMVIAES